MGDGFYSARAERHGQPPSALDALRDSWQDLDTHYDKLEQQFWQFYPRMMAQATRQNYKDCAFSQKGYSEHHFPI
jgi:acyl carrier protein phosphodiesterase